MKRKVLVLGREDRAFLAVIRSLGRRGIEVHVGWCPPDALALRSRYVAKVHEIPAYAPNDDAWKVAFIRVCKEEGFDLVLPTNDASVIPLQEHRAELEPYARLYVLGDEAFDVTFDKSKTYELAQSMGVRLPRQLRLSQPVTPASIPHDWYPLVLKPLRSFRASDLKRKLLVHHVAKPGDLQRQLQFFTGEPEILVQERFHGAGAGVEMLVADGEVLLAFQHQRLHERRQGGAGSYRVSMPLRQDMFDAAARLVGALRYTGVVMVEFRVDLESGDWVLLEINGRFWASLPLCLHAGADFPYYLYQLLVEGRRDFPRDYRVGVYCRNWHRDMRWLGENLFAPHGDRVPLRELVGELGPALRMRESSDTCVLDDPWPGIVDVRRIVGAVGEQVWRRGGRIARMLPGVRRMEAIRARRAMREARELLFVCKGNICRSPFAEAYARATLNHGVQVVSAGFHPRPDRACPENAARAARELGIEIGQHRSHVVSEAMMRSAHAVFTFDEESHGTLTARFPFARDRIFRLGALVPQGPVDIRDPYGGTPEDFRATYGLIRSAIDSAREVLEPQTAATRPVPHRQS